MHTILALVLASHVVPSPDQPWALETVVDLQTPSGSLQVHLPGGSRDGFDVAVSHTPTLAVGSRYVLDVVVVDGVWRVAEAHAADPLAPPPYVLAGSSWGSGTIPVDFFLSAGSFPSSFDASALEQAYTDVLRTWNRDGRARVALAYGGLTANTQYGSGSDGSNTTKYEASTWGSTLAVSVRTTVGSEIRDCDIRFYGSNSNGAIDWNLDPLGAPQGENALRHTLVHELGHCLGISHSADPDALMYAYAPDDQGPGSWVLHADDVAALQAIYGEALPVLSLAEVTFGTDALTATVSNTGDWTAFDVEAEATLEGSWQPMEAVGLGDLAAGDAAVVRIPLNGESCGVGTGSVSVTDAFDAAAVAEAGRDDPCQGPGAEDPAGVGCACDAVSSPGMTWLVLPLLGLSRRRRAA